MSRAHDLASRSVIDLRCILLEHRGYKRGGIEALVPIFSGTWIEHPRGRFPVLPWDRDRLVTEILHCEE